MESISAESALSGLDCFTVLEIAFTEPNLIKAPFTQGCDLRATFVRPEKWLGRSVVAGTQ